MVFYLGVRSILLPETTEKTPIARVVTVWYACPSFPYLRKFIQYIYFPSNFVIVSCFAHKLHLPTGQDCLGEHISQEKTLNIHASWWFHLKETLEKI